MSGAIFNFFPFLYYIPYYILTQKLTPNKVLECFPSEKLATEITFIQLPKNQN